MASLVRGIPAEGSCIMYLEILSQTIMGIYSSRLLLSFSDYIYQHKAKIDLYFELIAAGVSVNELKFCRQYCQIRDLDPV